MDTRMVGSAMRRRAGAPSSVLAMTARPTWEPPAVEMTEGHHEFEPIPENTSASCPIRGCHWSGDQVALDGHFVLAHSRHQRAADVRLRYTTSEE